jgi:hypothetical protein
MFPRPALLALDVENLFGKFGSLHRSDIQFGKRKLRRPMQETIQTGIGDGRLTPASAKPGFDAFRNGDGGPPRPGRSAL